MHGWLALITWMHKWVFSSLVREMGEDEPWVPDKASDQCENVQTSATWGTGAGECRQLTNWCQVKTWWNSLKDELIEIELSKLGRVSLSFQDVDILDVLFCLVTLSVIVGKCEITDVGEFNVWKSKGFVECLDDLCTRKRFQSIWEDFKLRWIQIPSLR